MTEEIFPKIGSILANNGLTLASKWCYTEDKIDLL